MEVEQFQQFLLEKGHELYRDMPWRRDTRAYYVLVSELMLQQTQVSRVIPKFEQFIEAFPGIATLAAAPLADVLTLWQGLGYNRRAKFLLHAAQMILHELAGQFPNTLESLLALPGVGKNTAGAILAYAYNQPSIFIETNIRTVYIHHFFGDTDMVDDTEIQNLLQLTLDHEHPREFYWALMDYGTHLKSQGLKAATRSAHYKKQSPLEGSVRQVRGQIIKAITRSSPLTDAELRALIAADERYEPAFQGLVKDGIISVEHGVVAIANTQSIDKK